MSVSITVSVHASVSASVSVSALVTVYCYFRLPGALPPPSPQLLQLPFCSLIPGTVSLNNPLSPGAEKCHPEGTAHPSIAVGFSPIRSHPCERHRLRSTVVCVPPHSMGSGAGTASKLKRRYTGFSSIQRGITVPEVGVPAAVLVNAKLTPSREAPPRPRTSPRPRYFSLGQKPVALREPILQPLQPRCPGCCCCSCCTASDVCRSTNEPCGAAPRYVSSDVLHRHASTWVASHSPHAV